VSLPPHAHSRLIIAITLTLNPKPAAMRESIYLCWDLFEKLGNHLNSLLDRRQNGIPKWRDILIAGGYFSKYTDNVFSTEFRDYFEYFKIVKDIDLFYFNPRSIQLMNMRTIYILSCRKMQIDSI
jgi:hypothetical protein